MSLLQAPSLAPRLVPLSAAPVAPGCGRRILLTGIPLSTLVIGYEPQFCGEDRFGKAELGA